MARPVYYNIMKAFQKLFSFFIINSISFEIETFLMSLSLGNIAGLNSINNGVSSKIRPIISCNPLYVGIISYTIL